MNSRVWLFILFSSLSLVLPVSVAAEFCKWMDEHGVVHYAETCPEGSNSSEVKIHAPRAQGPVDEAYKPSGPSVSGLPVNKQKPAASLTLEALGPLPENASSRFLKTTSTGISINLAATAAQFSLHLKARSWLDAGAVLEAVFPDPANPGKDLVAVEVVSDPAADIFLMSPPSSGFRCRNYQVVVHVYEDSTRNQLLSSHHQVIQSRIDLSLFNSAGDMITSLATKQGNCPVAAVKKTVPAAGLAASCEREREKRIAPLRRAEIEKCRNQQGKDPQWCERYFSDYGNARRVHNTMVPRMFNNLPECVEARKAKTQKDRD
jgi:hypothetical protein